MALCLLLVSGVVVFAASVNGEYAGLPVVKVKVNGQTLETDTPAVVLDGRTLLPVRAIAENLGAVVSWDQKTLTASVLKPDIQLLFVSEVTEKGDGLSLTKPYSSVTVVKNSVNVYFSVGAMEKKGYDYRIVVKNPSGTVISIAETQSTIIDENGIDGYVKFPGITFETAGNYAFEFQFKHNGSFETMGSRDLLVK